MKKFYKSRSVAAFGTDSQEALTKALELLPEVKLPIAPVGAHYRCEVQVNLQLQALPANILVIRKTDKDVVGTLIEITPAGVSLWVNDRQVGIPKMAIKKSIA